MLQSTQLPPDLQEVAIEIEAKAREVGLDFFTTVFEVVDYQQLNEIAAYGGFPTRYPHWRWGMEYERISKSYTYGLSVIYEMVINNDPCYAYLLRANSMVAQKTVIAHVFAHCDFFKNNYWFSKTNRKMLDQMANHATLVRNFVREVGQEEVEQFIDVCLSLENLIDINSPFVARPESLTEEQIEELYRRPADRLDAKNYMDRYINTPDFIASQKEKNEQKAQMQKRIPPQPEQDILKFLIQYGDLSSWQRRILGLVRDEAYYFAPQAQTKILNEGWATYWHGKFMTEIYPLSSAEIVDYCDQNSSILATGASINPYRLGVDLLRYVEERWDKGRFGIDYLNCEDHRKRSDWDTQAGEGRSKLFEVRKLHNDLTFIDTFLDEDFCHEHKMFLYDVDPRTGKHVISSRDFGAIKSQLLGELTNFGQPIIKVVDGNFRNRGELLLQHLHEGRDLKQDFALETLRNLHAIWSRPVHILTTLENTPRRISFDGGGHTVEKT